MTLQSERWLDQLVVAGAQTDIDGDRNDDYLLPGGVGDVAVMRIEVIASAAATILADASLANAGARAVIITAGGSAVVNLVALNEWMRTSATAMVCHIVPDSLALWRQDERLRIGFPELDTNGVPTLDLSVMVQVVRVRPIETPAGPIQLVR